MQIKFNELGYITEYMLDGSEGILLGGVEYDSTDVDIVDFIQNFKAYKYADGLLARDDSVLNLVQEEIELEQLRLMRTKECFPIINRGKFWYDSLTEEQIIELKEWYQAWLDVTETRAIPELPAWI